MVRMVISKFEICVNSCNLPAGKGRSMAKKLVASHDNKINLSKTFC
jgi:hypothetical protein